MKIKVFMLTCIVVVCFFSACEEAENSKAIEYNSVGLDSLNLGNHDAAIREFKKAYALESSSRLNKSIFLRNISLGFHEKGEVDSTLHYLKQALNFCDKNSYDYYYIKGDISVTEGKTRKAIKELKMANKIKPVNLEANNLLGLVYLGDYGEEYVDYDRALEYNIAAEASGGDAVTKNVLARNYYLLENYAAAEPLYQELVDFNPDEIDTKWMLGLTKYHLDKNETAASLLQEVVDEDFIYRIGNEDVLDELKVNY